MKTQLTIAGILTAALFSVTAQAAQQEELQMARGQAAIVNALVVGAQDYAPAEIKQARETMDRSRRAMAQKDLGSAMRFAILAGEVARAAEAKAMQLRSLMRTASR